MKIYFTRHGLVNYQDAKLSQGLQVSKFSKDDFKTSIALEKILSKGDCLVCYRIETINIVFSRLGLPLFNNENRDEAYEYILVFDQATSSIEKINTGYSKNKLRPS